MFQWLDKVARGKHKRPRFTQPLQVESLENRLVPSSSPLSLAHPDFQVAYPEGAAAPAASAGPVGFLPDQIRHAYGFDQIRFGTVQGDGSGQTIAIIGAFDNPDMLHDLTAFDQAFGLPAPSAFTKVDEYGGTAFSGVDPKGNWELESALDVEWAHALAPGASIVLVEARTASFGDLNIAVDYARHLPGVSVVSMSYGGSEFSGENADDGFFTTPPGHAGVTFVAATGDKGKPSEYPATSPNVLAVGGTSLTINSANDFVSETGWDSSGGGVSPFEVLPAYQKRLVGPSSTGRSTPDVAFDADPNTGVAVYDSYNNGTDSPWVQIGGTSFAAPAWAALIAVADQGRALAHEGTLDGPTETLPDIYRMPGSDFHDVTGGSNGFPTGTGYDLVTGRGSPVANRVVANLVRPSVATHFLLVPSVWRSTAGTSLRLTVTALDANGNAVTGYAGTIHFKSSDPRAGLPADYTFVASDRGSHTFTVVLKTVGRQSFSVADVKAKSLSGTRAGVVVSPALATRLKISAPAAVTARTPFLVAVEALDAYNNLVPDFRGTIRLYSSDAKATLPGSYTYTSADRGEHRFTVTLGTVGTWVVGVDDLRNLVQRSTVAVTCRKGPA